MLTILYVVAAGLVAAIAILLLLPFLFGLFISKVQMKPVEIDSTRDALREISNSINRSSCTGKTNVIYACAKQARAGKQLDWPRIAEAMTPRMLVLFVKTLTDGGSNPFTKEEILDAKSAGIEEATDEMVLSLLLNQKGRLDSYLQNADVPAKNREIVRQAMIRWDLPRNPA